MNWDKSVDLLIAGSGGGGMVAALAAVDAGIEPLVVEKQDLDRRGDRNVRRHGVAAEQPADACGGHTRFARGRPGVLRRRRRRHRRGVVARAPRDVPHRRLRDDRLPCCAKAFGWCDAPGAATTTRITRAATQRGVRSRASRTTRQLWGTGATRSRAMDKNWNRGFVVKTNELRSVQYFNRSPRAFAVAMRVFLRTRVARLRRREILTNGASIIGQILKSADRSRRASRRCGRTPRWTNSSSRTVASSAPESLADGTSLNVQARKGVLLAAGGFSRNADMRRRYSGDQPNEANWSIANAGDTGEVLQTAMRLGAKTDLLDEAWWLPIGFHRRPPRPCHRLGAAATRGHLRRRDRQAVLQRVELLRRSRQGDVRQQGRAVLADLR